MSKAKHRMLVSIEKNVEALARKETSKKVMEGCEEMTEKTDKRKIAQWVKGAMERLDALVNEETKFQIMENWPQLC